ncbi:ABC transporter substrate-binding protein [Collimonas sp. OK412]|jgi:ABC-type branched-subunit amino acid transport system substrate-binding protein|uniref:ABC transporter substrate-binding protein n=1 Tax=Collimonas sp. (strain OK412) TaxID=1801619 RepID=UPI0008ECD157|nr:ABC transporter substrate-binding protein [Collimonas sp. OK412]SFC74425.1 amino acid/amide ABC transporter substrate-binding protein, HAAT family [Collimonas sp. OK412]
MFKSLGKTIAAIVLAGATLVALAEDGVTDSTILIGQTIGVTGTVAGPVKEMLEGANAYFTSVNANGGVNGRKIKLITLDDKFDPALAASNAAKLIKNEHVFALFQSRGTPHTQAIMPVLEANHVPLIAPSTGASVFHNPVNPLIFNVRAKYQTEIGKAVEYFIFAGVKSIGLLHVDDTFGQDGLAGFNSAMKAHSLPSAVIISFARDNPDYKTTAANVIKAKPAALIIVSSSKNTIDVIKEIRAQGSKLQIMTLSNNSSESFIRELGSARSGIILGQITPPPDLVSTRLGQEFEAAAKKTHATASYAAMEGFVSAKVLVEGLRRAGSNLTRDRFLHALESIRHEDLGGLMITYTAQNHTGSEFVEFTMIGKDGRYVR